ncbi:hypothetical protein [Pseudomonas azerbaijanoccidentalis]
MNNDPETYEVLSVFNFHRLHTNISLESHVRQKRAELGMKVSSLQRIYLDIRFWIMLREVVLGRCQDETSIALLNFIREEVVAGRAICPISESVLMELLKQRDLVTRNATAQLIDDLSLGVALVPLNERISQELCNFVYEQHGVENLLPLNHLVWTKLAYVLGQAHPYETGLAVEDELAIQKAVCDDLWSTSLIEMLSHAGEPTSNFDWNLLADKLNAGSAVHVDQIKSYSQAFRAEFEGVFSLFKDEFLAISNEATERSGGAFASVNTGESIAKRFEKFSQAIPTLHIGSSCHAAVRWDQKRNLTGNDLFDFHHAEAALAYCDVFLTEKPLASLLAQRHLGLEIYTCQIFSAPRAALDWLRNCDR